MSEQEHTSTAKKDDDGGEGNTTSCSEEEGGGNNNNSSGVEEERLAREAYHMHVHMYEDEEEKDTHDSEHDRGEEEEGEIMWNEDGKTSEEDSRGSELIQTVTGIAAPFSGENEPTDGPLRRRAQKQKTTPTQPKSSPGMQATQAPRSDRSLTSEAPPGSDCGRGNATEENVTQDESNNELNAQNVVDVGRALETCWETVSPLLATKAASVRPPASPSGNSVEVSSGQPINKGNLSANLMTNASTICSQFSSDSPNKLPDDETAMSKLEEGLFSLWKICKECSLSYESMDMVNSLVHETKAVDILYKVIGNFGQSPEHDRLTVASLRILLLLASTVANEAGEVDTSATLRMIVKVPSVTDLLHKCMDSLNVDKMGILSTAFALLSLLLVADEPPLQQLTDNNILPLLVHCMMMTADYSGFLQCSVSCFQELADYQGQHSAIWIFDHVNLMVFWLHPMSWEASKKCSLTSSGREEWTDMKSVEEQLHMCCSFNGAAQLITRIIGLRPTIRQRLFRDGFLKKVLEVFGMIIGYLWNQPSVLCQAPLGAGVEVMEQFSLHPCASSVVQCLAAMVENSPQLQQYIALQCIFDIAYVSDDTNEEEPPVTDEFHDPREYEDAEEHNNAEQSVSCCLLDLIPLMVVVDPSSCTCEHSALLIQSRYALIYLFTALQFRCSAVSSALTTSLRRLSDGREGSMNVIDLLSRQYKDSEGSDVSAQSSDLRQLRYEMLEILHLSSRVLKCIYLIRKSHYDEAIVVDSLNDLSRLIGHSRHRCLAKYIVLCSFGATGMGILTHSLQNIDEAVMEKACHVLLALLSCNPCQCRREPNADLWLTALAHRRFAQAGGFSALSGCLHDYDSNIRAAALKVIESMFRFSSTDDSRLMQVNVGLSSQTFEPILCDQDVSGAISRGSKLQRLSARSGLLALVLKTLKDWPNKETPARVATAAVDVLSQAVKGDESMQTYWGEKGAISLLIHVLMRASRRMWSLKKRMREHMSRSSRERLKNENQSHNDDRQFGAPRKPIKSVPSESFLRRPLPPLCKSKRQEARTTENLHAKMRNSAFSGGISRPCSAPISSSRKRLTQETGIRDVRATVHPRQRGQRKHNLKRGFLLTSESESNSVASDDEDSSASDVDENSFPKNTLFSWDREDIETAKLMANATTALTNLLFKHVNNQVQFIFDGGLRLILRLLAGRWLSNLYQEGRRSVKQALRRSSQLDLTLLEHIDELSRDSWENLCYDLSFIHETTKTGNHLVSDEELNWTMKLILKCQGHGCCLPPDSTDPEIVALSRDYNEWQARSNSGQSGKFRRPTRPHRSAVSRANDENRDSRLAVLSMWGEDTTNGILSIITNLIDQNQISQAVVNTPATIKLFENMLSPTGKSASLDSRTQVCWIISHLTFNHSSIQESTGGMLPGIVRLMLEIIEAQVDSTVTCRDDHYFVPQWLVRTCQRSMEPLQQWSRSDIIPSRENSGVDSGLAAYTKSALDIPGVERTVDGTDSSNQVSGSPRTLVPLCTRSSLEKSASRIFEHVQNVIKDHALAPVGGTEGQSYVLALDNSSLQMQLAAVSAIVNQTYRNSQSQLVAGQTGIVHLLICLLYSLIASYQKLLQNGSFAFMGKQGAYNSQIRTKTINNFDSLELVSQLIETIVLALGNLVRDCSPNAEAIASCGGLPVLLTLVNDVDEDLLSKRVFLTLQHCGIFALQGLLSMVHSCCSLSEPRQTLPESCINRFLTEFPDVRLSSYTLSDEHKLSKDETMTQWLSKCLPILNGILFDAPGVKHWLIQQSNWLGGLGPLVRVVIAPIPVSIILYAANVIANLANGAIVTLQRYASKSDIVDILLFIAITATTDHENLENAEGSTTSGSDSGPLQLPEESEEDSESALSEAKSVLYSALVSLCVYCQPNCERICATDRALDVIITDTDSRGCEKEDATELLIVVAECACELIRSHGVNSTEIPEENVLLVSMSQETVLHVLGKIKRDYGGTATSVGARAAQCIVTLSGQELEIGRGLPLHSQ